MPITIDAAYREYRILQKEGRLPVGHDSCGNSLDTHPYLLVRPHGFVLDDSTPPRPPIQVRIQGFGGARTLYRNRRPHCRSLDIAHKDRRCPSCELKHACIPQLRIDLVARNRPDRLLLAHTSAKNFLTYEANLRQQGFKIDGHLHSLTVIDRGSWGEVRFAHVPPDPSLIPP